MDTATKTGIDAAKTASKRVVQKTAEATGDLFEIKKLKNEVRQLLYSLYRSKKLSKTVYKHLMNTI